MFQTASCTSMLNAWWSGIAREPADCAMMCLHHPHRRAGGALGVWYSQNPMSACHQPPARSHSTCGAKAGEAAGDAAAEQPASAVRAISSTALDQRAMACYLGGWCNAKLVHVAVR